MGQRGGKREGAGRPKNATNKIKEELGKLITKEDVALAFKVLRKKMNDNDNYAAMYLLDQKFGKARQKIDANLEGGIMLVVNDLTSGQTNHQPKE